MKKILLLGVLSICFTLENAAQRILIPSSQSCETSFLMNWDNGITPYGVNSLLPNPDFPLASLCFGAGAPHNLVWYRFRVKNDGLLIFNLDFDISKCGDQQGIQAGVFKGFCNGSNIWDCNAACNTNSFSLAGSVNKDTDYFLWVDGCNGDVCEYEFSIEQNELTSEGFSRVNLSYYKDENDNCDKDNGEEVYNNCFTTLEDKANNLSFIVNPRNQSHFYMPDGEYEFTSHHAVIPVDFCPDKGTLTVDENTFNTPLVIGGVSNFSCPVLQFNIVPPRGANRLRCDPVNPKALVIEYQNIGNFNSSDEVAILTLSDLMENVSMNLPFTTVGPNEYRVELNDLEEGEIDELVITYILNCNADDIGEKVCVKIEDETYDCAPDITTGSSDTYCGVIRLAYDPNDITVLPFGETEEKYINEDQQLDYLIRFQNTGNDTAYNVYIDLETGTFDPLTVRMTNTSHSAVAEYGKISPSKIRFYFFNINLVDSLTNEGDSHGYVKLSLKLDNPRMLERVLHSAKIFFDFNPPIETNEVFHTIAPDYFSDFRDVHICPDETFRDSTYPDGAIITDTIDLPGPDSIIHYKIIVHEEYLIEIDTTVARGDSIHGIPVDTDTFIQKLFFTQWDCDSLLIYDVTVEGTSSSEDFFQNEISVFPNPLTGTYLYFQFEKQLGVETEVKFYNSQGQLLGIENISGIDTTIDMEKYKYKGLIYYQITHPEREEEYVGKILKL